MLLSAAQAAAGGQQYPAGALYVVATPIGNLADLTLRSIYVLSLADAIACEDTRHSAPLLRHLGLDKPLFALHEHNEREAAKAVIDRERCVRSGVGHPARDTHGLVTRDHGEGYAVHAGGDQAIGLGLDVGDVLGAERRSVRLGRVFVAARAEGAEREQDGQRQIRKSEAGHAVLLVG